MGDKSAFEIGRLYVPLKAIADTLTASQKDVFIRLPGLMAYWTGGTRGLNAGLSDHSGSGLPLSQTGTCPTGYDGNPFVHLGNGVNYFFNTSAFFGQSGAAAWIDVALRGLTYGGWFNLDQTPGSNVGLISKDAPNPDRGYNMILNTTPVVSANVSGTGASIVGASSSAVTVGVWHFIVARFTPSTEVAIFLDGVKSVNATAVPATINASAQNFELGRYLNSDANVFHGRSRDMFICAAALSDQLIEEIRETSVP